MAGKAVEGDFDKWQKSSKNSSDLVVIVSFWCSASALYWLLSLKPCEYFLISFPVRSNIRVICFSAKWDLLIVVLIFCEPSRNRVTTFIFFFLFMWTGLAWLGRQRPPDQFPSRRNGRIHPEISRRIPQYIEKRPLCAYLFLDQSWIRISFSPCSQLESHIVVTNYMQR